MKARAREQQAVTEVWFICALACSSSTIAPCSTGMCLSRGLCLQGELPAQTALGCVT